MNQKLLAAVGYAIIVALLFHRLLTGEILSPAANLLLSEPFASESTLDPQPYLNGILGDIWRTFEPWHIEQFRATREGRFPLWNPYVFCGFPFHANGQSSVLSPFHWLYFLINPQWAAGLMAVAKLWIAGFATFLLATRLGVRTTGAFISGVAWMLSAYMVRWLLWSLASTGVWLPLLLLALDHVVTRPSIRNVGLAALVATCLQLSGHPETQFQVGVISGVFVLGRLLLTHVPFSHIVARITICLLIQVLGVGGAAVSIIPFAEQLASSSDWKDQSHARDRYLPTSGLIGAVLPDFYGQPRGGRIHEPPPVFGELDLNYVETGLYVGLLPLCLAMVAVGNFLFRPAATVHHRVGLLITIFSSITILFGAVVLGVPGIYQFVHKLPLFSQSDNLRLLLGIQFGLALLAGAGFDLLGDTVNRLSRGFFFAAAIGILSAISYFLIADHFVRFMTISHTPSLRFPLIGDRSIQTLFGLTVALLIFVWGFFGLRTLMDSKFSRVHGLAIALVVADLLWLSFGFNPTAPPAFIFPTPPKALATIQQRIGSQRFVATDEIMAPNVAMVYELRDARGYDFPIDQRLAALFQRLAWSEEMVTIPNNHIFPDIHPQTHAVLTKCCVRFILSNQQQQEIMTKLPVPKMQPWAAVQLGPGRSAVYENSDAYARTFVPRRIRKSDQEDALEALCDPSLDLREETVVESDNPALFSPEFVTGVASITRDNEESVELTAQLDADGLVVLHDRFDKGWQVTVDGQAAEPLRVNYLFRGVRVPEGRHEIVWTYKPSSFSIGCFVSLMSLAVMLGCVIVKPRPRDIVQTSDNIDP